ncbi:hypothetical protein Acj9p075 [Acinetobacter phage Acj9]|uniref:Uncharacterized protein n=1 Tax=Acinetobacter phage Acj9 TaxID=760939 RepID=E5EPK9_9CAUD|nr:hypothetical protein Acj9p075 [Acinetobacter phage Acj9]ADG59975.1 hypothetical protein Acj9p075 [Acinetobacter phage Acj9]
MLMFVGFYAKPSDDRAIFANKIFALIYKKYQGNFSSITFQNEARDLANDLEEYVRNIYECVDREIPMMAWVNLLEHGFDESAFDDEDEMTEQKWQQIIFDACKKYYE